MINTKPDFLPVIFGLLGNIISFLVLLAPVPTFYRIFKDKTVQGSKSLPYLVTLFSAMVWLYYGVIHENAFFIIIINSLACVIETIYVFIYIVYASTIQRKFTIKILLLVVGLFSLIFCILQFAIKHNERPQILGWICVAVSVCVFVAPMTILAEVIRTKNVKSMPFGLSFFLTVSAVVWFFYGLFQVNYIIAIPNVTGFLLGLIQMIVYIYCRSRTQTVAEDANNVL